MEKKVIKKIKLKQGVKDIILIVSCVIILITVFTLIQERISELENNKDAFNNRSIVLVNPNK